MFLSVSHLFFLICVQKKQTQWCRRRGCRGTTATPDVLICRKSGKKNWKSGHNLWKSEQTPWKSGQKWHQTFAEKHMKIFLAVTPKKCLHDLCGRRSIGKVAQKLFGQVWGNLGKNPSHHQRFSCSYTYEQAHCTYIVCVAAKDFKAQREDHIATRLTRLEKSHTHKQNTLWKTHPNGCNCYVYDSRVSYFFRLVRIQRN